MEMNCELHDSFSSQNGAFCQAEREKKLKSITLLELKFWRFFFYFIPEYMPIMPRRKSRDKEKFQIYNKRPSLAISEPVLPVKSEVQVTAIYTHD